MTRRSVVWSLSLARVATAPLLLGAILHGADGTAFAVTIAAAMTDVIDGRLARRWRVTSAAGALVDALSDAALLLPALWLLADQGRFAHAPLLVAAACLLHFVLSDEGTRYDPVGRHLGTACWGALLAVTGVGASAVPLAAGAVGGIALLALVVRHTRGRSSAITAAPTVSAATPG